MFYVLIVSCYRTIASKEKKDNEEDYKKNKFLPKIPFLILVIWWIINNILILTNTITDGNGIEIYSDLDLMFP